MVRLAGFLSLFVGAGLCDAQSIRPPSAAWTSFAAGFGLSGATGHNSVYEPSGQLFGRIAYTRPVGERSVEVAVLDAYPFGAGDCFSGPCAPPFTFAGAVASIVTGIFAPAIPDRATASLGAGAFRVAPDLTGRVSPRLALGLEGAAEFPIVSFPHAALTLGLRAIAFPMVHDESLAVGILSVGFRAW